MELKEFILSWHFDLDPESDDPSLECIYSFDSYEEAAEFLDGLNESANEYPGAFYEGYIFERSTFLIILSDTISKTINDEKKKREENNENK